MSGWVLLICGILALSFMLLVGTVVAYFSTRRRAHIAASFDEMADIREEVAILREEVEQLRDEVAQAKKEWDSVSSLQIKELK